MVPPSFTQDIVDINACIIFYPKNRIPERKATPIECIGLQRASVSQEMHIICRIEDFINNRKNVSEEGSKVILSTDDIRYNSGPFLRWNFDEEKFYRVTEEQLKADFYSDKKL